MLRLREAAALDCRDVLTQLETSLSGLSSQQAQERLARVGPNSLGEHRARALEILARQLANPMLVLLVATALASLAFGDRNDAITIIAIIALSVGLGFANEYSSARAMADLVKRVRHKAVAIRDGRRCEVDVAQLVPGDLVRLAIGDIVPADLRLCEAAGLSCDEAVLTGESRAAEKQVAPDTSTGQSASCNAYMGTTVKTGSGEGAVIATGAATAFGAIAAHLSEHPPMTAFQIGLTKFSGFLVRVTAVLTITIFIINAALHHPLLDSLLFSLAIAVGLTPQLLPAIVTVSLATGARRLAQRSVIIKRLVSIEDLGNIDVLFTDKTGTLTLGSVAFAASLDESGVSSDEVFGLGLVCNDAIVSDGAIVGGTELDRALWEHALGANIAKPRFKPIASLPFDYDRRLISVLVEDETGKRLLITKGAPETILAGCTSVDPRAAAVLDGLFASGRRVIALGTRDDIRTDICTPADERNLRLRGFIAFEDPIKPDAAQSLKRLRGLGIDVRIVTGDNEKVAANICSQLGLEVKGTIKGDDLDGVSDADLSEKLPTTTIFARVTPDQKSRIIRLQRALGSDVGFLGDGVNDAVAMHYADVGISVDSGSDVAKDAADVVLLQKDLGVLADGVVEGRRIFSNTIKYVLMGTSSNFGNMFSAAGASLFLSFLPMTASQILLNNLLYDVSEMTIPTDNVDEELLERPSHWDLAFIRRFMLVFGPISSIFDYVTFGVMLWVFHAGAALFQSAWFVESLLTQSLIIFVIRTRRVPFFRSLASTQLIATTVACVAVGAALPFTPLAHYFGFVPLPPLFFAILMAMIVTYLLMVEIGKYFFFRPREAVPSQAEVKRARRLSRIASRWMRL